MVPAAAPIPVLIARAVCIVNTWIMEVTDTLSRRDYWIIRQGSSNRVRSRGLGGGWRRSDWRVQHQVWPRRYADLLRYLLPRIVRSACSYAPWPRLREPLRPRWSALGSHEPDIIFFPSLQRSDHEMASEAECLPPSADAHFPTHTIRTMPSSDPPPVSGLSRAERNVAPQVRRCSRPAQWTRRPTSAAAPTVHFVHHCCLALPFIHVKPIRLLYCCFT
jgi:hypothetical protein